MRIKVMVIISIVEMFVIVALIHKDYVSQYVVEFPNDVKNVKEMDNSLFVKLVDEVSDSIPRISRYYVKNYWVSNDSICVRFQRLEHLQDVFIQDKYGKVTTASDYVVLFLRSDTSYVGINRCKIQW